MDIEPGTPVEIYWNLHKKVFSVRSRRRSDYGLVIDHVRMFHLKNPVFVVREAGRQQVLRERRKNIHAFVRGEWGDYDVVDPALPVTYNPYQDSTFIWKHSNVPVHAARNAFGLTVNGVKPMLLASYS
jgi:hypothetical protein